MQETDRTEFEALLVGLAEIFDRQLSEAQLDLYFGALQDLSIEDVRKAANVVARTCKFFPKPAELREQVAPDIQAQASLAYDKVDKAFYGAGVYRTVIFDDPVIHAVIESLGGWVKFCNLTDDEVKWWRKDFEKKYVFYAAQIDKMNVPKSLPGIFATDSHATEEAVKPVLIGDRQKALEWTGQKELPEGEKPALRGATG